MANILKQGYEVDIDFKENPRKELASNDLEVSNAGLVSLGFEPITLSETLIDDVKFIAEGTRERFSNANVMSSPKW